MRVGDDHVDDGGFLAHPGEVHRIIAEDGPDGGHVQGGEADAGRDQHRLTRLLLALLVGAVLAAREVEDLHVLDFAFVNRPLTRLPLLHRRACRRDEVVDVAFSLLP